jgi:hypothetical protein
MRTLAGVARQNPLYATLGGLLHTPFPCDPIPFITKALCVRSQAYNPLDAMMNTDLGSSEVCPPTRTDLETAPKPFSVLFDKLSPYFLIFYG